jgi:hypothetical protein
MSTPVDINKLIQFINNNTIITRLPAIPEMASYITPAAIPTWHTTGSR